MVLIAHYTNPVDNATGEPAMPDIFAMMAECQCKMLAARERTGDPHISVQAKAGKQQVVRSVPNGRKAYEVTPLSGWLSHDEAMAFLESLK